MVLKETNGRLGIITLDRAEKRNAFNSEFIAALQAAFDAFSEDENIKVVILKANGTAFSAGADLAYLTQLQSNTFEENLADSTRLKELYKTIYTFPKIVIAQVEGAAIAGGCGLATVCDFVYATPESTFGYTEVKIGFIPAIVMFFLIRKLGEAKARHLLLTGKVITSTEALELGIVTSIYQQEKIAEEVLSFANNLAESTSSQSILSTKKMIAEIQSLPFEEALNYAAKENAMARSTEDCKRGIAAFLNKEKIGW